MVSRYAGPELAVAFRHFYPGFDANAFWIPLLEKATGWNAYSTNIGKASLVFTSVYETYLDVWKRRLLSKRSTPGLPRPPKHLPATVKSIWVSGENLRPPAESYDLTISFDTDSYGGRNVYWPYIFENLDWGFNTGSNSESHFTLRGVPRLLPIDVSRPRKSSVADRPGFVCAFIGNPEPIRLRAIEALRAYGKVEVFGSAFGRPIPNKYDVAKDFKFVLAFENDVYPGYVTEKPLEAYACGAIPLWRGLDSQHLLNPKSMVNALDFPSLDLFAQHVATLAANRDKLEFMTQQALFNETPSLHTLEQHLASVIHSNERNA